MINFFSKFRVNCLLKERSNARVILGLQCRKFVKAANGVKKKKKLEIPEGWGVDQLPSGMEIPGGGGV